MEKQPKTRQEKKGRDKQKGTTLYSTKHVRQQERLAELQKNRNDKKVK
jgi:hypothetical protein